MMPNKLSRAEWILIAILLLATAAVAVKTANAADPECEGVIVSAPEVDAPDGNFRYCTPSLGETGIDYPDDGPLMSCFITNTDGIIINQTDGLAPRTLVSLTFAEGRFDQTAEIYCQNDAGSGVAVSTVVHFPADIPGPASFLP